MTVALDRCGICGGSRHAGGPCLRCVPYEDSPVKHAVESACAAALQTVCDDLVPLAQVCETPEGLGELPPASQKAAIDGEALERVNDRIAHQEQRIAEALDLLREVVRRLDSLERSSAPLYRAYLNARGQLSWEALQPAGGYISVGWPHPKDGCLMEAVHAKQGGWDGKSS